MKKLFRFLLLILLITLVALCVINWDFIKFKFEAFSEYMFPANENGRGELFKIILSVFGAVAVVFGLYISLRRAKAMEKGVEKQSESINNQTQQLELSRKSQIDERFKNAIEHLGSDKEPIILGGIAELHQIAKENKDTYSEVVFNILCSYITTTAHIYTKKADDINHKALQTIVNYLFKKESNKDVYNHLYGNLSHSNLLGLDLKDCNLKNFNMSFCYLPNLSGSDLSYSKLSNSILRTSKLIDSNFFESDLFCTVFHFCEIKSTIFDNAKISKTVFLECIIEDVKFDNIDFHNVNFSASYIKNISLNNCSIVSGDFSCAHIDEVDFSNLNLFGSCDFRATSFNNVLFQNIITSSKFNGASYDINRHPQLFDSRLRKRVWKENEIKIHDLQYGKNEAGKLTDEDCKEIKDKITKLENIKIEKTNVLKKDSDK